MYVIYKITNLVNGKVYIGYTCTTAQERFVRHVRDSRTKRAAGRAIARAIRKYGRDSFAVATVEEVETLEIAKVREMYHIGACQSIKPKFGYNMTAGGDGPRSEETKLKMSQWRKGMKMSDEFREKCRIAKTGPNNPFWGKKRPDIAEKNRIRSLGERCSGPKHVKWKDVPVQTIVSLYQSGLSTRRIGAMMGVNYSTIRERLIGAGVSRRNRWEGRVRRAA